MPIAPRRLPAILLLLLSPAAWAEEELPGLFSEAIRKGDLAAVEKMLAAGADPSAPIPGEDDHYTPLLLAISKDQPAITEALLKAGADPKIEGNSGVLPIFFASEADRIPHAKLLMQHGVSIDSRSREGTTALMWGMSYEKAADVKATIELGADPNLTDSHCETALMLAARACNEDAVKILLDAGAKTGVRDLQGQTALMLAAGTESYGDNKFPGHCVELLVKAGADLNQRDSSGRSALMLALGSWEAKKESIEALLAAKPDLSFRSADGYDALALATRHKERNVHITRLLELGADPKTVDNDGTGLLMLAAGNADLELVDDFLKRGLSPTSKDHDGQGAVHHAVGIPHPHDPFGEEKPEEIEKRILEIVKHLQLRGASLTEADKKGRTPLHLAALEGYATVVAYLLPFYPDIDLPDAEGITPLHAAAGSASLATLEALMPKVRQVEVRTPKGETPFHYASSRGDQDVMMRLLEAGADIDATDNEGNSALGYALSRLYFDSARFLVSKGADPKKLSLPATRLLAAARLFNDRPIAAADYAFLVGIFSAIVTDIDARDADGMTALMWVAASNVPDAVKAVLARGPDQNLRSPDGRTALMWAGSARAEKAMQLLKDAGADEALRDPSGRSAADWLAWANGPPFRDTAGIPREGETLVDETIRVRREALEAYLKQGIWNAKDRITGSSPLHLAASLDDTAAISTLLERGAAVNQILEEGETPLMEAAAAGQLVAVELLLVKGANPAMRDGQKQRAIDHAMALHRTAVVRLLLHREQAFSKDESPALVAIIRSGDLDLFREILSAGASIPPYTGPLTGEDPFEQRDHDPAAVLNAAALHPDPSFLRICAEFPAATGASISAFLVKALHHAADQGRLQSVKFLIEELKADPNALLSASFGGTSVGLFGEPEDDGQREILGYSPLSRALEGDYFEIVRYLVSRGATIAGRTRRGEQPLSYTITHHQPELLRLFLDHGASTELRDLDGYTALHHAASANDEGTLRLLLEKGAHRNAKSKKGKTPLDLAREINASAAVKLLEDGGK